MGRTWEITGRYDYIFRSDPRTVAQYGAKGATCRYIPASGDPLFLQKNDDGLSTNWSPVGVQGQDAIIVTDDGAPVTTEARTLNFIGFTVSQSPAGTVNIEGGGVPAGSPNELGGYDGAGVFGSLAQTYYDQGGLAHGFFNGSPYTVGLGGQLHAYSDAATGQINAGTGAKAWGNIEGTGEVTASGQGSSSGGFAQSGSIIASGQGSFATGWAAGGGLVEATAQASVAMGIANGASAIIRSQGNGSLVIGQSEAGGLLRSNSGGSLVHGFNSGAGIIEATGLGSMVGGNTTGNGAIYSGGQGSFAHGYAGAASAMNSSSLGSVVHGFVETAGLLIANSSGAFASGYATGGGVITGGANGAVAFGAATGASAAITANAQAAFAVGWANTGGVITSGGPGAYASGFADGANSQISSVGSGSIASGIAETGGLLQSSGSGSLAMGSVQDAANPGSLTAGGTGSIAIGAANGGTIAASASGTQAFGNASNGFSLRAGASSAFAQGNALDGDVAADGILSFASGNDVVASQEYSFSRGQGIQNQSSHAILFGRYPEVTPNNAGFVATDPLFVLGSGSSSVNRFNAFDIAKNGQMRTTGARIVRNTQYYGSDSTMAATDYVVFLQNADPNPFTVTLPPGIEGKMLMFSNVGTEVCDLAGDGADVVQDSSLIPGATRIYCYSGGTWFAMSRSN